MNLNQFIPPFTKKTLTCCMMIFDCDFNLYDITTNQSLFLYLFFNIIKMEKIIKIFPKIHVLLYHLLINIMNILLKMPVMKKMKTIFLKFHVILILLLLKCFHLQIEKMTILLSKKPLLLQSKYVSNKLQRKKIQRKTRSLALLVLKEEVVQNQAEMQ